MYYVLFGCFFKKVVLRRTLCTNRGRNDAHLHMGLRPVSLRSLCRNCCLAEPANPGVSRASRCAALGHSLSFMPSAAHQLPHQYLLLHPRANHPFLVASNLRSSTLGASTTYRNGPHFYVKCVQSSFKYSLNQAFIIETAGGKS